MNLVKLRCAEALRRQPLITFVSTGIGSLPQRTSTRTAFRHDLTEGLADLQGMLDDAPDTQDSVTHHQHQRLHHHRPQVGQTLNNQREQEEFAAASCDDGLCELDWETDDPISVMERLRERLQDRGRAVLTIHVSSPSLLLDVVGMLHLLNQDAHEFDSSVWFQPAVLDPPSDPSPGPSAGGNNSILTLLVRLAKTPELLRHLPSNTLFTRSHALHSHDGESALKAGGRLFAGHARDSPGDASNSRHSEATLLSVHDTARELVERLDMHESSQLQCLGPKSLVVALRALRRARKLMHRTGVFDLLVVPMILTDYDRPMICFNCWKRKRKSQAFLT